MKRISLIGCLLIGLMGFTTACDDDDDDDNTTSTEGSTSTGTEYEWSEDDGLNACDHILFTDGEEDPDGNEIGNGDQEFVFTGTQTLEKGTYLLKGWVYIADGATLTIEAGSIIKGDKDTKAAIVVERGGKLIAEGTASSPIVFTSEQEAGSRKPGDWGGIILCGNAKNNQTEMQIEGGPRTKHGGDDDEDNSGTLRYVRIEFAGYPFETDKEINGLTMGSVGSGTTIDHIQVSYCNDDSYEWFGGSVNCKYLVAYYGWDDDFDTDNGFSGNVQFGLVIRNSRIADTSQSNGFESDNCADGSSVTPYTTATFSNITFVGPKVLDSDFENTTDYINGGSVYPNNGSALGRFQSAMHIRRNSRLNCYNSVAMGYPIGLILDNEKGDTQGAATDGELHLENIIFAGMDAVGTDYNKIYTDSIYDYTTGEFTGAPSFSHTYFVNQTGNVVYDDWSELVGSDGYTPISGSPLLSGASFTDLDSWFTTVSYIGAVSQNDTWLDGWTEFDPENASY